MAGFTNTESKTILDLRYPTSAATDYIAWSADGTTETGSLARLAVGATGWVAATTADPSVKANANALTSAAASGTVTVSHFSIYDASTAGNQKTDWTALAASKALVSGDQLTVAASTGLNVTLT